VDVRRAPPQQAFHVLPLPQNHHHNVMLRQGRYFANRKMPGLDVILSSLTSTVLLI
jgi:hypothetical protein